MQEIGCFSALPFVELIVLVHDVSGNAFYLIF